MYSYYHSVITLVLFSFYNPESNVPYAVLSCDIWVSFAWLPALLQHTSIRFLYFARLRKLLNRKITEKDSLKLHVISQYNFYYKLSTPLLKFERIEESKKKNTSEKFYKVKSTFSIATEK